MSHSGYESMGERYRELLDTVPLPSPLVGASTDVRSEGSLAAKGCEVLRGTIPGAMDDVGSLGCFICLK